MFKTLVSNSGKLLFFYKSHLSNQFVRNLYNPRTFFRPLIKQFFRFRIFVKFRLAKNQFQC